MEDEIINEYNGLKVGDKVQWTSQLRNDLIEVFVIDEIKINSSPKFYSKELACYFQAQNCKKAL